MSPIGLRPCKQAFLQNWMLKRQVDFFPQLSIKLEVFFVITTLKLLKTALTVIVQKHSSQTKQTKKKYTFSFLDAVWTSSGRSIFHSAKRDKDIMAITLQFMQIKQTN